MEQINLNKYIDSWKKNSNKVFKGKQLSDSEIKNFMNGKSKDITKQYRLGLIFDISLKSILSISLVILLIIWGSDIKVLAIGAVLLIINTVSMIIQSSFVKGLPKHNMSETDLRLLLESKINYYYTKYKKIIFIGGLSTPLIFLTGMLYYFLITYGYIRPFEIDDFIVFGSGVILSYVISIGVQFAQFKFYINQLKSCLNDIDEDTISQLTLYTSRNHKNRMIIAMILLVILGTLLLLYFLT
jgi:hypothetical protein